MFGQVNILNEYNDDKLGMPPLGLSNKITMKPEEKERLKINTGAAVVQPQINGEQFHLDIVALGTYEDFDSIVKYLQKWFSGKIIEIVNGPDMRLGYIDINSIKFKLVNDPYGNTLSCPLEGEKILIDIANDLNRRLE
jgi:hypothetical protein